MHYPAVPGSREWPECRTEIVRKSDVGVADAFESASCVLGFSSTCFKAQGSGDEREMATQSKRDHNPQSLYTMSQMDISKDDAIAHLAKWHDAATAVRAVYTNVNGNLSIVGKISSLSQSAITIAGGESEMLLYLRGTSLFDYKDAREVPTKANKDRINKYPTVIDIKFSNGDRVVIVEYFSE